MVDLARHHDLEAKGQVRSLHGWTEFSPASSRSYNPVTKLDVLSLLYGHGRVAVVAWEVAVLYDAGPRSSWTPTWHLQWGKCAGRACDVHGNRCGWNDRHLGEFGARVL